MKKTKIFLVILLISTIIFNSQIHVLAEDFDYTNFNSIGIYVVEVNTGRVLIDKNSDEKYSPASITKVLSIITALDYMGPNDRVDVTKEIIGFTQPNSSMAEIVDGERLTFSQTIDAMLIPSGNDASYALAVACGKIILNNDQAEAKVALDAFITEMNIKAKSIGMTNSVFLNPDGYPVDGMYSTAKDLSMLGLEALKHKEITSSTAKTSVSIETNKKNHKWVNSNLLIHKTMKSFGSDEGGNNPLYDSRNLGLKTGNAGDSKGRSLLFYSVEDDMALIGAVLHVLPSAKETTWSASNKASNYSFNNFDVLRLIDNSNREAVFEVSNNGLFVDSSLNLIAKDDLIYCIEEEYLGNLSLLVIPNEEFASMKMNEKLSLKKSLSAGDEVATGTFYYNNIKITEVQFIATESYRKVGIIDYLVYFVLIVGFGYLTVVFIIKSKDKQRKRKRYE